MWIRVLKTRLVVLPLAVLFLVFSAGAAAAPDCHIETTAPTTTQSASTHNHGGIPHDHQQQAAGNSASGIQGLNLIADKALQNEMCFVVGFIVLLLSRFLRVKKSTFTLWQISRPIFLIPKLLSKNLGYLKLTHLKLGIIRI
jgi:hypothetical protein